MGEVKSKKKRTNYRIEAEDIASLRPGQWLTGTVITKYATKRLDEATKEGKPNAEATHIFDALDGHVFTEPGPLPKRILKNDPKLAEENSLFIIPANKNGNHWILLWYDKTHTELSVYDPLNQVKKEAAILAEVEKKLRSLGLLPENTRLTTTIIEGLIQQDSYNCGIFVLMHIDWLLFGIEPNSNADEYRQKLYDWARGIVPRPAPVDPTDLTKTPNLTGISYKIRLEKIIEVVRSGQAERSKTFTKNGIAFYVGKSSCESGGLGLFAAQPIYDKARALQTSQKKTKTTFYNWVIW